MSKCSICGRDNPESGDYCECGPAPPKAKRQYDGGQQQLASRGARLMGQFIDAFVAIGLLFLILPLSKVTEGLSYLGLAGFLGYYLLSDGLPRGQSLGKRLLKIAVVNEDTGEPCTYWKSFLRNVTQSLGVLDWIWIFGSRQRRAGDLLAHTKVIALQ